MTAPDGLGPRRDEYQTVCQCGWSRRSSGPNARLSANTAMAAHIKHHGCDRSDMRVINLNP